MLIQTAIKLIDALPDSWVRVAYMRNMSDCLELGLAIHKGRRGRLAESWTVSAQGVYEAKIDDFDGGGLAVYPSTHPAARQYIAPRLELRWKRMRDDAGILGALHREHLKAVDDWIPFDRYSFVAGKSVCRGPDFLLQAYARVLEKAGESVRITVRAKVRPKVARPRVLHFGSSYLIANAFLAERTETGSFQ
jgi:hypothetical protein